MSASGFTLRDSRAAARSRVAAQTLRTDTGAPGLRASLSPRRLRSSRCRARSAAARGRLNGFGDGAMAGAPDLVFIHGGRAFGLELKERGCGLSDEERAAQVVLRGAGMRVEVARDMTEALIRLREMGIPLKSDAVSAFRGRAA